MQNSDNFGVTDISIIKRLDSVLNPFIASVKISISIDFVGFLFTSNVKFIPEEICRFFYKILYAHIFTSSLKNTHEKLYYTVTAF